jgi:hypothetical protein
MWHWPISINYYHLLLLLLMINTRRGEVPCAIGCGIGPSTFIIIIIIINIIIIIIIIINIISIIIMRYHVPLDVALAQLLNEYLSAAYRLPGAATTPLGTFRMEYWYKTKQKKLLREYLSAAYRLLGAATTQLGTFRMEYWYKKRKSQKQISKVKAPWCFYKVKMLEPLTFENFVPRKTRTESTAKKLKCQYPSISTL